jgi:DNA-binding response OmpR family regulator
VVAVIDRNAEQGRKLCDFIERIGYSATPLTSIDAFEYYAKHHPTGIVIFDLDTTDIDNRKLKSLKKRHKETPFMGVSSRLFHPELSEVMGQELNVCLNKPVDEEELYYWLKSLIDS